MPIKDKPSYTQALNVGIKSVNDYTPPALKVAKGGYDQPISTVNGNPTYRPDWCSSEKLRIYTRRENFPNTDTPIDYYLWQVPTGWNIVDGLGYWQSNGRYETQVEYIDVVPPKGDGGTTVNQVKVQAYSKYCNAIFNEPNLQTYVSNERMLYIDREPRLGSITASRTGLHCGDTRSFTVSVPPLSGADYYTWSLPAGWSISGSANGSTITVVPSGQSGGQISVAATLTCSSPAKTVHATPITISYNSNLATPVFSSAPYDIGSSTSYSIGAVPGAASYTWEASPNILINGNLSPLSTSSASVTMSQRSEYSGAGWVKVTAVSPQCGSSSVTKDVWVGVPEIIDYTYDGSLPNGFNYPACPYEQGSFTPIYNGYQGQVLEYRWTATYVSNAPVLTGPSLFIVVAGPYSPGVRMAIGLEVRTAIGWTKRIIRYYEIRDCDGGAEPWFAPNPVTTGEFTIEATTEANERYSYTLLDRQGNEKLSGSFTNQGTKVSTRGLPAGLYLLRIQQKGKIYTRRVMIKK